MNKSSKETVAPSDEVEPGQVLEVPYAFGKLIVKEKRDPKTSKSSGQFNVVDPVRSLTFRVLNSDEREQNLVNLNFSQTKPKSRKKSVKTCADTNELAAKSSMKQYSDTQLKKFAEDSPCSKLNSIIRQKKSKESSEPQATTSAKSTSKTDIDKPKSKTSISKKSSVTSVDNQMPCTSREAMQGEQTSQKRQKTANETNLNQFKALNLHIENMTFSKVQWGSLSFYSGKNLVYNHFLWGDEKISIDYTALLDMKVPAKIGKQIKTESLAEDYRHVLNDGFTLQRNPVNGLIQFKRVNETKKIRPNCYKIFAEPDKVVDVTSDEALAIFDENSLSGIINNVDSFADAHKYVKNLNLIIVINSDFMNKMGITLDRISRKNVTTMPYYIVLKLHAGYDILHNHLIRLMHKHLAKTNSLFEPIFEIDPTLNLK